MTFTRVRALIFVTVLFLTAGVVVIMAVNRDSQTQRVQVSGCPAGLIPAKTKMPEFNQVTINVYNGTNTPGLAQTIGAEFANRGLTVKKMQTAAGDRVYDEIAVITYGPDAVGAGWLVSAFFLVDQAKMDFQLKRKGPEVDVVIGTRFQQLATTTEVKQSIAALGNPDPPDGTCQG